VFAEFDHCLLLQGGGNMVYFGPTKSEDDGAINPVVSYLEKIPDVPKLPVRNR
jgi:hypothetical protein